MNILLKTAFAAAALTAIAPATAAPLWTVNTTSTDQVSGSGNGNSFTYTSVSEGKTLTVKATGWTMGYDRRTFTPSELASFGSNGLGVLQPGEGGAGAYHQVDNVNGWEFIVLQFDQQVQLTSATLNVFQLWNRDYTDNDAFIGWGNVQGAWNKTLTGNDISFGGSFNSNSDDYATAKQVYTQQQVGSARGNLWIIGGSVDGPDGRNDAFKLAQVQVAAVPEPATWAMMIGGFGLVGGAMRLRRRSGAVLA